MKAKKAIKRLHRVDTLLQSVIDDYNASTPELNQLLDGARSSIASVTQALVAAPARKAAVKADQPRSRKLSNAARKRLSIAAKKRWADARSKGLTTLSKKSSRKIA